MPRDVRACIEPGRQLVGEHDTRVLREHERQIDHELRPAVAALAVADLEHRATGLQLPQIDTVELRVGATPRIHRTHRDLLVATLPDQELLELGERHPEFVVVAREPQVAAYDPRVVPLRMEVLAEHETREPIAMDADDGQCLRCDEHHVRVVPHHRRDEPAELDRSEGPRQPMLLATLVPRERTERAVGVVTIRTPDLVTHPLHHARPARRSANRRWSKLPTTSSGGAECFA